MRLVIDTNIIISGLLWHGTPHHLMDKVRLGVVSLISSPILIDELAEILSRGKFAIALQKSGRTLDQTLAEMRQLAEVIAAPPLLEPVGRDPDDDHVLACAIAGDANLIVSGDNDLLILQQFRNVPIVVAREALSRIEAFTQRL